MNVFVNRMRSNFLTNWLDCRLNFKNIGVHFAFFDDDSTFFISISIYLNTVFMTKVINKQSI